MEKIYKAGLKFLVPLKLEENYTLIVKEAVGLVKADAGSILLIQNNELKRMYATSAEQYKVKPRKSGYLNKVVQTRKPMILSADQIAKVNPDIRKINTKSVILTPLYYKYKSLGVITLHSSKENFFTSKDMNVLKLFTPMASLAIRKAQLYDETQQAVEARDLFISMAAHELKTPLTTISGYTQLLYSKLSGADTAESRWIEELLWESSRLSGMVKELLEVDNIKTGKFRYSWKECSLKEVINRALKDFRFTHPNRKITFKEDLGNQSDTVTGDYDKLLQVVINLVENAIKFSPPDTEIIISLEAKSPYLILKVKDQGRGIPKKDLPGIFEKFYRGINTNAKGMGLGLFITKNIVTHHRGAINVRSKELRGTSVKIKLPVISHITP